MGDHLLHPPPRKAKKHALEQEEEEEGTGEQRGIGSGTRGQGAKVARGDDSFPSGRKLPQIRTTSVSFLSFSFFFNNGKSIGLCASPQCTNRTNKPQARNADGFRYLYAGASKFIDFSSPVDDLSVLNHLRPIYFVVCRGVKIATGSTRSELVDIFTLFLLLFNIFERI